MLEQPGMLLEENFSHHWTTGRVGKPITLSYSFLKWLISVPNEYQYLEAE